MFNNLPDLSFADASSRSDLLNSFICILGSLSVAAGVEPSAPVTLSPSDSHALVTKILSTCSIPDDTDTPIPLSTSAASPLSPARTSPRKVNLLAAFIESHPASGTTGPSSDLSDDLAAETFIDAAEADGDAHSSDEAPFTPTHLPRPPDAPVRGRHHSPPAHSTANIRSSMELAIRTLLLSDIVAFQRLFHLSHLSSANSHHSDSFVPDASILNSLPLPDLVQTHTYVMSSWWATLYIRALVLRESIPGATDTSRLRSIFASLASLDQYAARSIRSLASKDTPGTPINPVDIATANPSLGFHALNLALDSLTYDCDHAQSLNVLVQSLNYRIPDTRIIFDGHRPLLTALAKLSRLQPKTISSLDLRPTYKALVQRLMPVNAFHFVYTYLGEPLDWSTYVDTVVSEHRRHGSGPISLHSITCLAETIDTYDGAMTDKSNTYGPSVPLSVPFDHLSMPRVHALSPTPPPAAPTRSELDDLRSQVAALQAARAKPSPHQAPPHPHSGRDRGYTPRPPKPQSRPGHYRAPVKVRCRAPNCHIQYNDNRLACHCGLYNVRLSFCLDCLGLGVGRCYRCLHDLDPSNSRLVNPTTDAAILLRLRDGARVGDVSEFTAPRPPFSRRAEHAFALSTATTLAITAAGEVAEDPFDETFPLLDGYAFAFRSVRTPRPPFFRPFTPPGTPFHPSHAMRPLMLVPAATMEGPLNLVSSDQMLILGFSGALTLISSTLTDPSGTTHPLTPTSNGLSFSTQLVTPPGGKPFFGLGFPAGSGSPHDFIFDTAANVSALNPLLTHALQETAPGIRIRLADGTTITSINSGLIAFRCHNPFNPTPSLPPCHPHPQQEDSACDPPPAKSARTGTITPEPRPVAAPAPDPRPEAISANVPTIFTAPRVQTPTPPSPAPPGHTWHLILSPAYPAHAHSTSRILVAYEDSCSLPLFQELEDDSPEDILAAISVIIFLTARSQPSPLRLVTISRSSLDANLPVVSEHSGPNHFTLSNDTPYAEGTFLDPLIRAANSANEDDMRALDMVRAACSALYDPAYAPLDPYSYPAVHLLELGSTIFSFGLTDTPHGPMHRHQAVYGALLEPERRQFYRAYHDDPRVNRILGTFHRSSDPAALATYLHIPEDPPSTTYAHAGEYPWLLSLSPPFPADPQGNTRVIAAYSIPNLLPHFIPIPDASPTSIRTSVDILRSRIHANCPSHFPFTSIIISDSHLDPADPIVRAHATEHGYSIFERLPHPDDQRFPAFIQPFASACHPLNPAGDHHALHVLWAAYDSLLFDRYACPVHGRLAPYSLALLQHASTLISLGRIDSPLGPISRFQSLTRTPPDLSNYLLTPFLDDPSRSILSIYLSAFPKTHSVDWNLFARPPGYSHPDSDCDTDSIPSLISNDNLTDSDDEPIHPSHATLPPTGRHSDVDFTHPRSDARPSPVSRDPVPVPITYPMLLRATTSNPSLAPLPLHCPAPVPSAESTLPRVCASLAPPLAMSPPSSLPAPHPLLHPLTSAILRVSDILAPQLYDNTRLIDAVAESGDPADLVHIADLPQPNDPATVSLYGYLPINCFRNGLDMCAICTSLVNCPDCHLQPLTKLHLGLEHSPPT